MKLIEKRICVDKRGCIQLPREFINAAAIQPGAKMTVTIVMKEECLLPCPVMVISPDGPVVFTFASSPHENETPEDGSLRDYIALPREFLNDAGIPIDSDLDITCVPGAIIIKEPDVLDKLPEELRYLFQSFGIHPETVREIIKKEGYLV